MGVGCGCIFGSLCAATVSTNAPDRYFALAQAVMNVFFVIMFIVLPYTLHFGHQIFFLTLGCLFLFSIPLLNSLPQAQKEDVVAIDGVNFSSGRKLIVYFIIGTMIFNIGMGAMWGFIERIGKINIGLDLEEIGRILSLTIIVMVGGSLLAAWIRDRFGRARPMFISVLICGLSSVLISNTSSVNVYMIGLFFLQGAYLFTGPYIMAGIPSVIDSSGRLAALMGGVTFFSYSMGISLGGVITNFVSVSEIGLLGLTCSLISGPIFIFVCRNLLILRE